MPPRKRLGQLLTELGVVDEHQLQSALGHQKQWGGKLGAVLVQKGFCKEAEVVSALSKHLGMPSVKLREAAVDARAVKFVSKQIAEKLHVFPYEVSGSGRSEVVTIAMSDPTDLSAVDQLAFHTGKRIKPVLAGDSEIVQAIQQHYAEDKGAAAAGTGAASRAAAPPAAGPGARPAPTPRPAPARSQTPAPPPRAANPAPAVPQGSDFPRRVSPPAAMAPSGSPLTAASPPPSSSAAAARAQNLEELEPEESISTPPPKPQPLDLPADDGEMMGLEPIAAHSQFGDEVAGQEDVAGEGSAADTLEGLESAGVPHEGAEAARLEGLEPGMSTAAGAAEDAWSAPAARGWQAEPPEGVHAGGWAAESPVESSSGGWDAAEPAPPEGWTAEAPSSAEGWGAAAPREAAADAGGSSEAAQGWSAPQEQAAGWGSEDQAAGAAWGGGQGWGEEPAASSRTAVPEEELPVDAILGTAEAGQPAMENSGWGEPHADAPPPPPTEVHAPEAQVPEAQVPQAWADTLPDSAAALQHPALKEGATSAGELQAESRSEPSLPMAADEAASDEVPIDEDLSHEVPIDEEPSPQALADEGPSHEAPLGDVEGAHGDGSHSEAAGGEREQALRSDSLREEPVREEALGGEPRREEALGEEPLGGEPRREEPLRDEMAPEDMGRAGELAFAGDDHASEDAPDAWGSSEDPLAARTAAGPDEPAAPQAWDDPRMEPPSEGATPGQAVAPSTDKFALANAAENLTAAPEPDSGAERDGATAERGEDAASEGPSLDQRSASEEFADFGDERPGVGRAADEPKAHGENRPLFGERVSEEEAAPDDESTAQFAALGEEPDERRLEGWVAPPAALENQDRAWFGQQRVTPLSAADLGTLASVGVDPGDGIGTLRLLATLVRILHRHQLLDPDELASGIRESQAQAASELAASGQASEEAKSVRDDGPGAAGSTDPSGEPASPSEPAET